MAMTLSSSRVAKHADLLGARQIMNPGRRRRIDESPGPRDEDKTEHVGARLDGGLRIPRSGQSTDLDKHPRSPLGSELPGEAMSVRA